MRREPYISYCDTLIDPMFRQQIISISRLKKIVKKVFGDLEGLGGYLDYQRENEEETIRNL